jgi:hypothetical protein
MNTKKQSRMRSERIGASFGLTMLEGVRLADGGDVAACRAVEDALLSLLETRHPECAAAGFSAVVYPVLLAAMSQPGRALPSAGAMPE